MRVYDKQLHIYALYHGDKFIDLGTQQEISKRQNIKLKTLQFYGTNVYKNRIKGKEENRYILIKIEGEEDGEGNK